MIILAAFAFGFALGWLRAARRGGDRLDRLQYAAAHAIAFALVGLALVILAMRIGLLS